MRNFDFRIASYTPAPEPTYKYPIEWTLVHEPNLWTPGKKPIGPVKIDWSHGYTEGLIACYIFTEGIAVDLVTQQTTPLSATTPWASEGLDCTSVTTVTDLPVPVEIAGSDQFTFMFKGRNTLGTSTLNNALISYRNGASTSGVIIIYPWDNVSGDGYRAYFNGFQHLNENTGAIHFDTNPHSFTLIGYNGSVGSTLWVDQSRTVDGGVTQYSLTSTPTALTVGGWRGTTQLAVNCYLHHLYVWDHNIAETQARDLHADPYQFLIPAGVES